MTVMATSGSRSTYVCNKKNMEALISWRSTMPPVSEGFIEQVSAGHASLQKRRHLFQHGWWQRILPKMLMPAAQVRAKPPSRTHHSFRPTIADALAVAPLHVHYLKLVGARHWINLASVH